MDLSFCMISSAPPPPPLPLPSSQNAIAAPEDTALKASDSVACRPMNLAAPAPDPADAAHVAPLAEVTAVRKEERASAERRLDLDVRDDAGTCSIL